MPSRKCPHCRARSSYENVGSAYALRHASPRRIIFQQCKDADCQGVIAVLHGGSEPEELFPSINADPDEGLPEHVEVAFREALSALDERIWNACVMMCSRALDEATTDLEAEGESLFERIENLADTHRITPELGEWANTGRLAANLSRHGAEKEQEEKKWNDESDAREIVEYSRWFFRYVYVLPKQLTARKARLEEDAKRRDAPSEEAVAEEGAPEPNV